MNLIFCTSPLQVLIAKEIIKNNTNNFVGVYCIMSDDIRQEIYANKLKEYCCDNFILYNNNKSRESYIHFLNKYNIENLYVASLDNPLAYYAYQNNLTNLYTFDDGSSSIIVHNRYTIDNYNVTPHLDLKTILNLSKKHFTIFDKCVLFPKEKQVKIILNLEPKNFQRAKNGKTIKVFLGQFLGNVYNEEDATITSILTQRALKKLQNAIYYPHPRIKTTSNNILQCCFEEEIYNLLTKYEFVEVYGFYSTSLLVVQNIEGVTVKGFRTMFSVTESEVFQQNNIPYENLSLFDTPVSVVIPVFNNEKTILDSIQSVLNQTHDNLEIVLVNDGSTDNTLHIIQSHFGNNNRVNILNNIHKGISLSLIDGIEFSKFNYIARQDGDDVWLPFHLDLLLYEFHKNNNLDLVSSRVVTETNQIKKLSSITRNKVNDFSGETLWTILAYKNCINHPTVLFKKEAYYKAGGYNPKCNGFEDWELWSRLITKNNALVINVGTVFYRTRDNEEALRFRAKLAKSRGLTLQEVLEYDD